MAGDLKVRIRASFQTGNSSCGRTNVYPRGFAGSARGWDASTGRCRSTLGSSSSVQGKGSLVTQRQHTVGMWNVTNLNSCSKGHLGAQKQKGEQAAAHSAKTIATCTESQSGPKAKHIQGHQSQGSEKRSTTPQQADDLKSDPKETRPDAVKVLCRIGNARQRWGGRPSWEAEVTARVSEERTS